MFDLGIIGGGPAGYTAAERAGNKGLSVVLFEMDRLGGVCLNEGCIPAKTLLHSAKVHNLIENADKFGIHIGADITFDLPHVIERKDRIVEKLTTGVQEKLTNANATIVQGKAEIESRIYGGFSIKCSNQAYEVKNLMIATGSSVDMPEIPGIDSPAVCTHRDLLSLEQIPSSMVIIGGGIIGIEFANFFASIGVQVSVIEIAGEILNETDKEISAILRNEYEKRGIQFFLKSTVTSIDGEKVAFAQDGEKKSISGQKVLIAAGRRPNLEGFGLEKLDVECYRKGIRVSRTMLTSEPNVYAAGDVTGFSKLAHAAYREAEVAVNVIAGEQDFMNFKSIPTCIYSDPEIAYVGISEESLKMAWMPHRIIRVPMSSSGRFVIENGTFEGLCKIIVSESDEILGVHVVGNSAPEIIASASMAIDAHMTVNDWRKTIFPHPTVTEIFREALFSE
jgi:dihydrolipoamide dehydrogenase